MIDIRKQIIGDITNSHDIVIANGDIQIQIDKGTYIKLREEFIGILKKEFDNYSKKAIEHAKIEIDNYEQQLLTALHSSHKSNLIEKFHLLSMQQALHDSLRGYICSEDAAVKSMIIDSLIERLETDGSSTEAAIINEAISIIPGLNSTTLSLLAIMSLRHFKVQPKISFLINIFFTDLSPIINNFKKVTNLSIDHIIQKNCTKALNGIELTETFENIFINQYDLFFRKKGDLTWLYEYEKCHPEVRDKVKGKGTCIFGVDGSMKVWSFPYVSSEEIYHQLNKHSQNYLIPIFEELKQQTQPFSQADIRAYFKNINENWSYVFTIMNSNVMKHISLNSVGLYIGLKYIHKYTHGSTISISNYLL